MPLLTAKHCCVRDKNSALECTMSSLMTSSILCRSRRKDGLAQMSLMFLRREHFAPCNASWRVGKWSRASFRRMMLLTINWPARVVDFVVESLLTLALKQKEQRIRSMSLGNISRAREIPKNILSSLVSSSKQSRRVLIVFLSFNGWRRLALNRRVPPAVLVVLSISKRQPRFFCGPTWIWSDSTNSKFCTLYGSICKCDAFLTINPSYHRNNFGIISPAEYED